MLFNDTITLWGSFFNAFRQPIFTLFPFFRSTCLPYCCKDKFSPC